MTAHALLIGINYTGSKNALHGCIRDAENVQDLLIDRMNIPEENIHMMTDESSSSLRPYADNIRTQIKWLVEKSKFSKYVMVHFSGHGTQTWDKDSDETDRLDEILCALDYPRGYLKDDEIFDTLVSKVQCPVFMLFDCCHSGSAADLKYKLRQEYNKNRFIPSGKDSENKYYQIMISGCRDDQTSADASFKDENNKFTSQGAMTKSFLNSLVKLGPEPTLHKLLIEMRSFLQRKHFKQVPQLTCNMSFRSDKKLIIYPIKEENEIEEIKMEIDVETVIASVENGSAQMDNLLVENSRLKERLDKYELEISKIKMVVNGFN